MLYSVLTRARPCIVIRYRQVIVIDIFHRQGYPIGPSDEVDIHMGNELIFRKAFAMQLYFQCVLRS